METKLIAFDLDGTFLDDDKNIPEGNIEALRAAAEAGIEIVPATGRIYSGVPQAIRELPFIRYYILINGAQVYDAAEDRDLYKGEIPPDVALRLCEYMDTLPVIYDCYQYGQGWMSERLYRRVDEFVKDPGMNRLVKTLRVPVPELKDTLRERGEGVQKLQMFFTDMEELLRQRDEILPRLFPELLPSTSVKTNIELNSRNAGKDKGLAALCAHLGIELSETLAFGDSTNDTDMLSAAGTGVAMANADRAVLAAADAVTLSNNRSGVARYIWEKLLGRG